MTNLRALSLPLALVPVLGLTSGCAAMSAEVAAPVVVADRAAAQAVPAPLDRSLFARDPQGQLTEEALQKILDAPTAVALPARTGVLPIVPAVDWRGPGPSYNVSAGASMLSRALTGTEPFPQATEILPIPSGALGMEALREMAARYKLRYLILYREDLRRRTRANGLAAIYATILGAFFVPGATLHTSGYLEASVLDVKTGLLLFTVRRGVQAQQRSNEWHKDDKLDELEAGLRAQAAVELARDLRMEVDRFARAVKQEEAQRSGTGTAPVKLAEGQR
jgi:rhombotail lipoprotein